MHTLSKPSQQARYRTFPPAPKGSLFLPCRLFFPGPTAQGKTDLLWSLLISFHFLESYAIVFIQCVLLCVWILSLSIMILRFIHVVLCISCSLLLCVAELYSMVWICHILFLCYMLIDIWVISSSYSYCE